MIVMCATLTFLEETYDDFVGELRAAEEIKECRYGAFDAEFEVEDGKREKIVLFIW